MTVTLPGPGAEPAWQAGEPLGTPVAELLHAAPPEATLGALPPGSTRAASWRSWEAAFKRHLRQGNCQTPLTRAN